MIGARTRLLLATWLLLVLALAPAYARREPMPILRSRAGAVVGAGLPLIKQGHPDAAGHIRSRAPGFPSSAC